MGLKDMSIEDFQKTKEILNFLENVFGITEEDLKLFPKMVELYKSSSVKKEPKKLTEKEKLELKNKVKPEQFVKMFEDDAEEFYPNGKR